jgi:hypothetical protein
MGRYDADRCFLLRQANTLSGFEGIGNSGTQRFGWIFSAGELGKEGARPGAILAR